MCMPRCAFLTLCRCFSAALLAAACLFGAFCSAQTTANKATPEDPTAAVLRAFDTHDLVLLGEMHGNKQLYEWLRALVADPAFANRVDDIVVEFGNSLYQLSVDRYVSGENVPMEQVQKAWRNMVGAIGPPSPVYESLYQAVRETNMSHRGKHQMRIVCGDPYIDWDKVKSTEDIGPFLAHRDEWYAEVVQEEVLAKHHRALLIMGSGHFLRRNGAGYIEQHLREAGFNTYLIIAGTNTIDAGEVERRFDAVKAPAIISTTASWVGELPAQPVTSGGGPVPMRVAAGALQGPQSAQGGAARTAGSSLGPAPVPAVKLRDAADALLYLGPADSLTEIYMGREELDGTAYGKELIRRFDIMFGHPINFIPDQTEVPQFSHPRMTGGASGVLMGLPPMPKSAHDPLPPRPPSE